MTEAELANIELPDLHANGVSFQTAVLTTVDMSGPDWNSWDSRTPSFADAISPTCRHRARASSESWPRTAD
jgi:hypothetical protein